MVDLWIDRIDFELGQIFLISDGERLCALDFSDYEGRMMELLGKRFGRIELVEGRIPQGFGDRVWAYLKGDLRALDEIPVSLGGTMFQQQVWLTLRQIPVGEVWTYGQLAERVGRPTAYRAVGFANSLNPVAIVLPCHRVVGANGSLTGYAGGLERKRWLLEHEGVKF